MKYCFFFNRVSLSILFIFTITCSISAQQEKASDGIITLSEKLDTIVPFLPRLCDSINSQSISLSIGDCNLFVETEGTGEPLVLINGGPGGTHHYFHPWFSRMQNNFKIIYYDQRGTGQSDFTPNSEYSFDQAVNDLELMRKNLGLKQWTLLGYSYGGGLAQYYAIKYPESVKGLILVSSLPMMPRVEFKGDQNKYISEEERDKRNEIISAYQNGKLPFNALLLNLTINGDWKRQHYLKPSNNQLIRAALYEWVNDKNFNSIMSNSLNKYDFEHAFDTCPIPTLILEGDQDLTWGTAKPEIFRKNHPKATYYLIKNAGHPLYSEAPDEFFTLITKFMKNHKKATHLELVQWKQHLKQKSLINELH